DTVNSESGVVGQRDLGTDQSVHAVGMHEVCLRRDTGSSAHQERHCTHLERTGYEPARENADVHIRQAIRPACPHLCVFELHRQPGIEEDANSAASTITRLETEAVVK